MAVNETVKSVNDFLKKTMPGRTPQPIVGPGKAKKPSEAEVEMVFYEWCQDIISDLLQMQMETRPEQIAKAQSPNAKPEEAVA